MSQKVRLRRLEASVGWLETEGRYRRIVNLMKLTERLQDISDGLAADPARAAQWRKDFPNFPVRLPAPRVAPILREAALRAAAQSEEVRDEAPPLEPTLRDADVPAAPQGEVVRVQAPPVESAFSGVSSANARKLPDAALPAAPEGEVVPPEPALVQPFLPNVPEHLLRPVRWRPRTAQDDYDDEDPPGTNGRCLTEYDPLAGEYDDDS